MEESFFQSEEWQRYYDEEVQKSKKLLEEFSLKQEKRLLTQSRSPLTRPQNYDDITLTLPTTRKSTAYDSPLKEKEKVKDIIKTKGESVGKENVPNIIGSEKQELMRELMKLRGKLQLEHEEILRQEKRALIAAADMELKRKVEELRTNFFAEKRKQTEKKFMEILESLINHTEPPIEDTNDEDRIIRIHAMETAKRYEAIGHEYYKQKLQRSLPYIRQALIEMHEEYRIRAKMKSRNPPPENSLNDENIENRATFRSMKPTLSSEPTLSSSTTKQPLSQNHLQQEIKRIMLQTKERFRQEYQNPAFLSQLSPENIPKVRELEKLIDGNMKLAAQIVVLRQLKFHS